MCVCMQCVCACVFVCVVFGENVLVYKERDLVESKSKRER